MPIISQKQTSASLILSLCQGLELFTDPAGIAWVGLPTSNGYPEYVPLKGGRFTGWANKKYFEVYGKPVGQRALEDARAVLLGYAAETVKRIYNRVASLGDVVYVDLGDRYVEIRADGWAGVSAPPVPFRRPAGMLSLPMPEAEYQGRLADSLEEVAGITGDNLALVTAWILGAYGTGDYPILVLNGEQGTGKSTLAELLKLLIDPAEVALRVVPRDAQALAVAAVNSWIVALDNLSSTPKWLADTLCSISTGAGYSARKLYFDLDEIFAKTHRPVILNGIPELAVRGDMQDRSIVITLPTIPEVQRQTKTEILRRFETLLPVMLAQTFDAVSAAIAKQDEPLTETLPRMADFATWATHGCDVATWGGGGNFLNAYLANRQNSTFAILDASPLAQEVQALIAKKTTWVGTATSLKSELLSQTFGTPLEHDIQKMPANALANELRRLAPALRRVGVNIEFTGLKKVAGVVGRYIEITDLSVMQGVNVP